MDTKRAIRQFSLQVQFGALGLKSFAFHISNDMGETAFGGQENARQKPLVKTLANNP